MKMASLVILIPPLVVLIGTAVAVVDRRPAKATHLQPRRRTASAKCCTPSRRPATTTAAPSPA